MAPTRFVIDVESLDPMVGTITVADASGGTAEQPFAGWISLMAIIESTEVVTPVTDRSRPRPPDP